MNAKIVLKIEKLWNAILSYLAFHEEFEKNATMNCSRLKLETFNASPSMKQINEWLQNR